MDFLAGLLIFLIKVTEFFYAVDTLVYLWYNLKNNFSLDLKWKTKPVIYGKSVISIHAALLRNQFLFSIIQELYIRVWN